MYMIVNFNKDLLYIKNMYAISVVNAQLGSLSILIEMVLQSFQYLPLLSVLSADLSSPVEPLSHWIISLQVECEMNSPLSAFH